MSFDFCDLGAAQVDAATGTLTAQCKGGAVSADSAPDYGQAPFMCALGLTAMPYPATDEGSAEAIIARDIPGLDGVVVGARDVRTAGIVGKLAPGDTVVHSTGPQQAAMTLYKEKKRQVVHRTIDKLGKDMVSMLDGVNEKATIAAFGYIVEISRENGITIGDSGAMLQIKDGMGCLTGTWLLGGRSPIGNLLYSVGGIPVVGGAAGGGTGTPAPGIFVGI